jgi:type IV pilus assembly protein PilB
MLCNKCKEEWKPTKEEFEVLKYEKTIKEDETFFKPKGCVSCRNTGYSGRIAIHEVLVVSPAIQKAIIAGAKGVEINTLAVSEGMVSMRRDGFEKVAKGLTSFQEVLRVTV